MLFFLLKTAMATQFTARQHGHPTSTYSAYHGPTPRRYDLLLMMHHSPVLRRGSKILRSRRMIRLHLHVPRGDAMVTLTVRQGPISVIRDGNRPARARDQLRLRYPTVSAEISGV